MPLNYHWEQLIDGRWQKVSASTLPASLKKKKAVLFASKGLEHHRTDEFGVEQAYRMVKTFKNES